MTYEQTLQIRNTFFDEHIRGKALAQDVAMVNRVRKWNDKSEPWYIKVCLIKPLPKGVDLPEEYKGLRVELVVRKGG